MSLKRPAEPASPPTPAKRIKAEVPLVLHWFRSDLRLDDNSSLARASSRAAELGGNLLTLYVVSPGEWIRHEIAPVRVDFWMRALNGLKGELDKLGIPLIVARAEMLKDVPGVVAGIVKDLGVSELAFNIEYEVNERARDAKTRTLVEAEQVKCWEIYDQCIVPPGQVKTKENKTYTVFTPFKNTWLKHLGSNPSLLNLRPAPSPNTRPFTDEQRVYFKSHSEIPDAADIHPTFRAFLADGDDAKKRLEHIRASFPAGPGEARTRLTTFVATHAVKYGVERNLPSPLTLTEFNGSSRLSPYLSAGLLSARSCIVAAKNANNGKLDSGTDGLVTWVSELCWRDFYRHILDAFPRVCKGKAFKEDTEKVEWSYDETALQKWKEGKTGFPIVDAGMRQLLKEGWMHNRLRMIVAMFLTKDLLIDWRLGESHFMKHLIDGDFASNNGGWQWAASTGTDSQPYFRVFNPLLQSEKSDPKGDLIRHYVPELRGLGKSVHNPTEAERKKAGYPSEMVKHDVARVRAVEAFKKAVGKG